MRQYRKDPANILSSFDNSYTPYEWRITYLHELLINPVNSQVLDIFLSRKTATLRMLLCIIFLLCSFSLSYSSTRYSWCKIVGKVGKVSGSTCKLQLCQTLFTESEWFLNMIYTSGNCGECWSGTSEFEEDTKGSKLYSKEIVLLRTKLKENQANLSNYQIPWQGVLTAKPRV